MPISNGNGRTDDKDGRGEEGAGDRGDCRHSSEVTESTTAHLPKSTSSSKWDDMTRTVLMLAWLEGSLAAWSAWGESAGWDMALAAAVVLEGAAAAGLPGDGRERCRDGGVAMRSNAGCAVVVANAALWSARRSKEQPFSMQSERGPKYAKIWERFLLNRARCSCGPHRWAPHFSSSQPLLAAARSALSRHCKTNEYLASVIFFSSKDYMRTKRVITLWEAERCCWASTPPGPTPSGTQ